MLHYPEDIERFLLNFEDIQNEEQATVNCGVLCPPNVQVLRVLVTEPQYFVGRTTDIFVPMYRHFTVS